MVTLYCHKCAHVFMYIHCTLRMSSLEFKSVPLQAWSGPEVSRKLRFLDYVAMAQNGSKVVSLTYRPPLPPGNTPGTHSR